MIDIEAISLKVGSHSSPDFGMCVMEAVAYVSGEPFSDHPACACPVVSAFLRSYNDSVSDEIRQSLKRYISRLVGTKGITAVEERRALIAADWLVRTHTPAWLRLAGLTMQADALASLPEITSMAQVPSIRGPIETARLAAWAAARDAAWAAAWAAARDAAWAAARDAAWDAARDALKPTVKELQATVPALIERMLAVKEAEG